MSAAATDDEDGVDLLARSITRDWMAHLGYTAEEIAEAEADPDHSLCDSAEYGWDCSDEDGNDRHPTYSVLCVTAELVMFTLERARGEHDG